MFVLILTGQLVIEDRKNPIHQTKFALPRTLTSLNREDDDLGTV
tara:strand:+ start:278 stop:409 length:132 start_codon:yes stop_codon:yes gene_type:complete